MFFCGTWGVKKREGLRCAVSSVDVGKDHSMSKPPPPPPLLLPAAAAVLEQNRQTVVFRFDKNI